LLDARRERPVRAGDFEDRGQRDFVARDLVELALLVDFFEAERWDFVSPFSRRILFTVRAATSSARPS